VAITDPQDTLAFHQSRVLSQHLDRSNVPCAQVSKAIQAFALKADHSKVPESEALWFYGMNHGMAMIATKRAPLEPLNPWELNFVEQYYTRLSEKATRAFCYLVRICTREARHCNSFGTVIPKVKKLYGDAIGDFFVDKKGEDGIWKGFEKSPPDACISDYCKALQWLFYHGSWSSGYGGKAWGAVTDCLVRYVTGEFSAEMMLDTIWTLSHNNGPIFNKSWLYSMYNAVDIVRLLDVQRSGQIPTACLKDPQIMKYVEPDLMGFMLELRKQFPNDVKDFVDWHVVEALGSVKKYPKEKMDQDKLYGDSPAAKAAKAAAEAKAKAAEEAAKQKAIDHAKNWFQVMPELEVKKVKIKRAA
jgi:hypothetical protein